MYYVVLIDGYDTKDSITNPEFVGPFAVETDAEDFVKQHPRFFQLDEEWWGIRPMDGAGYAAAFIVGPDKNVTTPDTKLAEWREYAEEFGEDAPAHAGS